MIFFDDLFEDPFPPLRVEALMKLFLAAALASLVFTASVAQAQRSNHKKVPIKSAGNSDCAKAAKAGRACDLNFQTGDEIGGEVASGTGDRIDVRPPTTHTSLIRLRTNFRDRIIRDAEWL